MIKKLFYGIIILLWLGMVLVGVYSRRTYTNITENPEFIREAQVAEMGRNTAFRSYENMLDELENADCILTVIPVSRRQYSYKSGCQECEVVEVHRGKNQVGETIRVSYVDWSVVEINGKTCVQCGYVNEMKAGKEYVVFLREPYCAADCQMVYPFFTEQFFAPIFCKEDIKNVVIPIENGPTNVLYSDVEQNEFFVASEEALQYVLKIKESIWDVVGNTKLYFE